MVMVTRQYGMLASEIASSEALFCHATCHLPFTGTNHGYAGLDLGLSTGPCSK